MNTLKELLKNIPSEPGVYFFKDENDKVIYIGKAKNLKNRIKSYFSADSRAGAKLVPASPKVEQASCLLNKEDTKPVHAAAPKAESPPIFLDLIHNIDFIITNNELEAILLEANSIKKFSPKYNVKLRDDKSYPFLKLTTAEKFPRLFITRKFLDDGNKYFGPYSSATKVRDVMELLQGMFPLRLCNKMKKKPCLYFYIKKCIAPCVVSNFQNIEHRTQNTDSVNSGQWSVGTKAQRHKGTEDSAECGVRSVDCKSEIRNGQLAVGSWQLVGDSEQSSDYQITKLPNHRQPSAISHQPHSIHSGLTPAPLPNYQITKLSSPHNEDAASSLHSSQLPNYQITKLSNYQAPVPLPLPLTPLSIEETYKKNVETVLLFLNGKYKNLIETLKKEMLAQSQQLDFEKAAIIRDRIEYLKDISEKQIVFSNKDKKAKDIICADSLKGYVGICVFLIRDGKLTDTEFFSIDNANGKNYGEILEDFIKIFYRKEKFIPEEVILSDPLHDVELVKLFLEKLSNHKVAVRNPRYEARGKRSEDCRDRTPRLSKKTIMSEIRSRKFQYSKEGNYAFIEMAMKNVREKLTRYVTVKKESLSETELSDKLVKELNIKSKRIIRKIVGIDISTTFSRQTIGVVVTFIGYTKARNEYRKYIIKGAAVDDFSAITEVLTRYLKRVKTGEINEPDLLIVDGGAGQMTAAKKALKIVDYKKKLDIISFAKENFFIYRNFSADAKPLILKEDSDVLNFIKTVIAETHRFAVSFHRKRRQNALIS